MISSNEVDGLKRIRLSKKEFSLIQEQMEEFKNEYFKELEQSNIYSKEKDNSKTKRAEQEMKHKRKQQTKKELVSDDLIQIFSKALSKKALYNGLV
jgi:elongation factor P--beta-lysine ligase